MIYSKQIYNKKSYIEVKKKDHIQFIFVFEILTKAKNFMILR